MKIQFEKWNEDRIKKGITLRKGQRAKKNRYRAKTIEEKGIVIPDEKRSDRQGGD